MRILLRSDSDDTNFGSESELSLFGSTDIGWKSFLLQYWLWQARMAAFRND